MLTYLLLMKATQEGLRKIKDVGDRYDSFRKTLKKSGGRLVGAWGLMGRYDYAAVVEVPSERDLLKLTLGIAERGTASIETLRAIPMEEFSEIAHKL